MAREALQRTGSVMEVHPLLAPGNSEIEYLELLSVEWMERMGDREMLGQIGLINGS